MWNVFNREVAEQCSKEGSSAVWMIAIKQPWVWEISKEIQWLPQPGCVCVCVLIHWCLMRLRITDGSLSQSTVRPALKKVGSSEFSVSKSFYFCLSCVSVLLCLSLCLCVSFSCWGFLLKSFDASPASLHGLITGSSCQRVGLPPSSLTSADTT